MPSNFRILGGRLLALAILGLSGSMAHAQSATGETYFIPLPAVQVKEWADVQQDLAENDTMRTVIGITATAADAILYWDHWEDGFEFDVADPLAPAPGAGAEIWGDGICANGYRPDISLATCNANPALNDHFVGGDVLVITSDVPVPGAIGSYVRDPSQIRFDGGDKLFATDLVAITQASWPSTGVQAQLGDAVEVYGLTKWGVSGAGVEFVSPVGENMGAEPGFEWVALSVMASQDGTRVDIDVNGAAAGGVTSYTIDQGGSVMVSGILVGATVDISPANGVGLREAQVNILTANEASDWEGRWFSLPPTSLWGTSYYAAAGSVDTAFPTKIYLFNPNAAALSVTYERIVGTTFTTSAINIPAGTGSIVSLPNNLPNPPSAAHFSAASRFYAVAGIASVNATDSRVYDWGHSLLAETSLTPAAVVGWAPGSTNLSETVSPVWVTPVLPSASTVNLYVDADGDPTTGPNVDPFGNRYNVICTIQGLRSVRIYDDGAGLPTTPPAGSCIVPAGDNDQTGMRIYTVNGTKIAAAWGQDVDLAAISQPQQLDMGTSVIPSSSLNAFKDGTLLVDLNGNGGIDTGDTILYTTVVRNTGIIPITEVFVTDTLDPGTLYVPNSFEVDGVPIADDGAGTAFPLDTDAPHTQGFVLVESPPASPAPVYGTPFPAGGRITITYQVVVTALAQDPIVNRVNVFSDSETFVDTSTNPIPSSVLQVTKASNVTGNVAPGGTIAYTVTLTNPSSSPAGVTGVRLTDVLPSGTSYVAQSTSVTGPQQLYVADRFGAATRSYANSNGPNVWDDNDADTAQDPWTEVNDGTTSPSAGDIQVVIAPGGGELRLGNPSGGAAAEIARPLDMSGFTSGFGLLRFDFRADTGVDIADSIAVDCSGNNGGAYTALGAIDWIDGDAAGAQVSGKFGAVMPVGCMTNQNRVRFRVATDYTGVNESFYVDNVELRAVGTSTQLASDSFPSFPGGGSGWGGSWTSTGSPTLAGGAMQLNGNTDAITRSVNLAGSPRPVLAVLSFDLTTSSTNETFRDEFSTVAYTNNNGTLGWATSWQETGDDNAANAGAVRIAADGGSNRLWVFDDANSIQREANLSGATSATLTFVRQRVSLETGEYVAVEASANGAAGAWTEIARFAGPTNDAGYVAESIDLTPYIAADTRIRFITPAGAMDANEGVRFDNVQIAATISSVDADESLEVRAAKDGSTFVTLARFIGGSTATRTFDLTDYLASTTAIQFRISSGNLSASEYYQIDNVQVRVGTQTSATKTNTASVPVINLVDGIPSSVTLPADSFALAPGDSLTASYSVTVANPAALTRITNTVSGTAFETVQPVRATVIDPIAPGGVIGDRFWLDVDGDGVQDTGEPGLSGVTVALANGTCNTALVPPAANACPRAITDLNGQYVFPALPAGSYGVTIISGVPAGLSASATPTQPTVITAAGEVVTTVDFGYTTGTTTAALGDRVWADTDADGIQDPGELGIGGVTVTLRNAGADGIFNNGDDTTATTVTRADGTYLFTGLAAGMYNVQVTTTSGPLLGRSATSGPQSIGGPLSPPVALAAGQVRTDIDFGYSTTGFTITDTLWVDENQNGLLGIAERGIAGVTVALRDNSGNLVATTTSNSSGQFTFTGVPNGSYTIVVTDNAGILVGRQRTTAAATAGQQAVTVSGANVTGVHFGYAQPGLIGDRVWSDADGDGQQDPGEPGIGGVSVELYGSGNDGQPFTGDDVLLGTATTRADGTYEFPNLNPGPYNVRIATGQASLTGFAQTGDPNFPNAVCTSCDNRGPSLLLASSTDRNLDFGYRNTSRPDVSGTVFLDANRNGVRDTTPSTETGIPSVEVALVAPGTDGIFGTSDDVVVATTTTSTSPGTLGAYTFPDVPAGNYRVEVRDGAGVLDGFTLTSGNDRIPITVAAADITGIDFGYDRTTSTGAIGDTLWIDIDPPTGPRDNLPGPTEPRLSGVTVTLYRDSNGNGTLDVGTDAVVGTQVTDADGQYLFSGLPAGSYFARPTSGVPAGLTAIFTSPAATPLAAIPLSDGQRYLNADFGYIPTGSTGVIGDFVWYDVDPAGPTLPNGLQDAGEIGIAGIGITLYYAGPDGLFGGSHAADDTVTTTTTAANGSYLFTNLVVGGRYLVTYDQTGGGTPPPTSVLSRGLDAQATNLASGQIAYDLTITAANSVITTADFGFSGGTFGSIGDQVWLDVDNDGVVDTGELGIPNVTLNLLDASNNILATTTTSAAGQYLFSGLPVSAGGISYRVQVSDVTGQLAGLTLRSPVTSPSALVSLTTASPNNTTVDFPYVPSAGTGTIGTSVWHDLPGGTAGVRDANEPPLEGVTVNVYFDSNDNGAFDAGVDNLVRSVVTDAGGNYEVLGLPFGRYFVNPVDPASGNALAGLLRAVNGTQTSDDHNKADPFTVVLSSGNANNVIADFGYRDDTSASGTLVISGTTFIDANVNATLDTEVRVQGATIRLYRVTLGVPRLIGVTTTDASGDYTFADLPPGSYEVRVDPTGTIADGFIQTTQTTTGGVQPVTLVAANSAGNNFGFFNGGITTTAVTLASFEATGNGDAFTARWSTATETGHVGFNLWAQTAEGWHRVNAQIIASPPGDTHEVREYSFSGSAPGAIALQLQELDVQGRGRFHGPFTFDRAYGDDSLSHQRIAWAAVTAEHAAKREIRIAQSRQRLAAASRSGRIAAASTAGGGEAVLLRVRANGIYRITFEQLLAQGLDLSGVDPDAISVTEKGEPVAIRVVSPSPGAFGPGGYVELVGRALDTLYTDTNVYRLGVDGAVAKRVAVDVASPTGVVATTYTEPLRIEQQRSYNIAAPGSDPWYDSGLLAFAGSPTHGDFTFSLPDHVAGTDVTLRVDLWGATAWPTPLDHHVTLALNETTDLGGAFFDGTEQATLEATIDSSDLEEVNTLSVTLPGDAGVDYDYVYVDGYTVEYQRQLVARNGALEFTGSGDAFAVSGLTSSDVAVYRVTGTTVERLQGTQVTGGPASFTVTFPGSSQSARYLVAGSDVVQTPDLAPAPDSAGVRTGAAELLIISHPDFVAGLDPLVQQRQSQGWTVKVADVEDVYAEFGGGVFDPVAIRRYIAYATATLGTKAVLLVGGDTYDYRDYNGYGGLSFLPTMYAPSGDVVRFAPADSLLADVDADIIQDVAIGRFPVRTSADLEAVIAKTLAYETLVDRKNVLFAADRFDQTSKFSFRQVSQELVRLVPRDWAVNQVNLDDLALADARTTLLGALDGGVALASYMGHSGPIHWSFDNLLDNGDAAALTNAAMPTVVMQWGCWTSYFVEPRNDTMAQRLLLNDGGGAAAVLGSATLTEATSERAMSLQVLQRAFQEGATLGEAVLGAKRQLAALNDPAVLDVLLGWNLLGDPTLGLGPVIHGGPGGGDPSRLPFRNGFESAETPWGVFFPATH